MVMLAWPELVMAAGCFFFLVYLRCWKYNTLPIKWPVVGMLPSMLLNIHRVHDWTTQLASRNRLHFPFQGPWFGCIDFLGTADPANVKYMFSTNFSNFPKGPEFKEIFDVLGDGIFNSDMDEWRTQRRIGNALINLTLDDFIGQCVFEKRQQLRRSEKVKEGDDKGMDLLTSYLSMEEEEMNKSDKFLRDTVVNYMFAGRDTVSSPLTWFFWLLSKNPSAETKLIEELKAISPKKNQTTQQDRPVVFDIKQLNGLVYLHGALCECLRLFPPVPFEHKAPIEQDILPSGHTMPPKSRILISLYAMGRMEEIWGKDCLQFKPERWISRDGRIKYEPPYKFMTFNAGPRICLGKEVAFTQMKMAVATLIYNYCFEPVEGHPVVPKNSAILHMEHGLLVRIKRRLI
ncbi:hypothetical protein Syun_024577 [Stephania yunnanensis]|uniref:Cytochrome P450 n=1 Tax=Stephania yunnanensis TaxID=152371 RepID=A0AAP0NKY9_9MAGN